MHVKLYMKNVNLNKSKYKIINLMLGWHNRSGNEKGEGTSKP